MNASATASRVRERAARGCSRGTRCCSTHSTRSSRRTYPPSEVAPHPSATRNVRGTKEGNSSWFDARMLPRPITGLLAHVNGELRTGLEGNLEAHIGRHRTAPMRAERRQDAAKQVRWPVNRKESQRHCAIRKRALCSAFPRAVRPCGRAHNSAVECRLHTAKVTGSNPVAPTKSKLRITAGCGNAAGFFAFWGGHKRRVSTFVSTFVSTRGGVIRPYGSTGGDADNVDAGSRHRLNTRDSHPHIGLARVRFTGVIRTTVP